MDFFSWASFALDFTDTENYWVAILVGALCFLLVYVFRAVALYTIAKREGFGHKWMAFVPFFSTYYIGVCAQANRIYNAKAQTISLIAAIVEVVAVIYFIFYYSVIFTVELNGFYVTETGLSSLGMSTTYTVADYDKLALHGWNWMGWVYDNGYYIARVLDLLWFVFSLLVYTAFFQTYGSRHYWLFAITSAFFPISGILFYVVRKSPAQNYRSYVRSQQEQAYRMRQQYYNQYNNPYNQNPYNQNPYNQNPYSRPQNNDSASDPFEGVGNENVSHSHSSKSDDDPFEGFDK